LRSRFTTICRQFTAVAAEAAGDAELLSRFQANRDDEAFALIVKRHGPMVWSVCRNLLANAADADDAFQATFLALARGAKSVRKPEALGAWLHGVAVRVANKLKRSAARRTNREKTVANGEASSPVADSRWDELLAAVHEEVAKLPDGERTAFVVCCLEGVRQSDAIARLGWKPGTLTGRLSKAKQRLLDRLTQRGLAPAAALGALGLGTTTGQATVPAPLVASVTNFAANAGSVPAALLELTQGVTEMTISKVKMLAAAVLVAGSLAIGGGAGWFANADAQSAPVPSSIPKRGADPVDPNSHGPGAAPSAPRSSGGTGLAPVATSGVPVARAPLARAWEHKTVDVSAMNRAQLKDVLDKEGADGWELAGVDSIVTGGLTTERTAIFKRQKFAGGTVSTGMYGAGMMPPGMGAASGMSGFAPSTTIPAPGSAGFAPTGTTTLPATIAPSGVYSPSGSATPAPAPSKLSLHTIPLQAATATNAATVLKELLAIGEFPGVTAIIPDADTNSLIVKASDTGWKAITERAKKLDEAAAAKQKEDAFNKIKVRP
jgi:RNA polymerase sigma factor (sigma-70 family)